MTTFARPPRPKAPRAYRKSRKPRPVATVNRPKRVGAPLRRTNTRGVPAGGFGGTFATPEEAQPWMNYPVTSQFDPANSAGTTPAPSVAPAPQAPRTPPTLPSSAAQRTAAETAYNTAQSQRNRGLYEAALRYGDPNLIRQFSDSGYGPMVNNNPNSVLSQIADQEQRAIRDLNDATTRDNTFFSGRHLVGDRDLRDQASRQRSAAYQEYLDAEARLNELLAEAFNSYTNSLGAADAADLQAWESRVPEDPGPDIPPETPPVAPPAPAADAAPRATGGRPQRRSGSKKKLRKKKTKTKRPPRFTG